MQAPDYLVHNSPLTAIRMDEISLLKSDDEFNVMGVSLFKEILSPMVTVCSIFRKDDTGTTVPYNHEEAALIGNLVRYSKLCSAFLEQITRKRTETAEIFLRCICETYINLKYFLKFKDEFTLRQYIKHSLRQEKKFIELVKKNVANKEQADHIETRMMESIKRSFRDSDFVEDEIGNSSKWEEKVKARMSEIINPEAYLLLYGSSSHAVHGNWQDLITFHLTKEGDGFLPNFEWYSPTLQIITATTVLSCDLLYNYSYEVLPDSKSKDELLKFIEGIEQRAMLLDGQHELFMQNRRAGKDSSANDVD